MLIQKALLGDQEAFTELYNQNAARIKLVLIRKTHNKEDAEDLTQASFIQAFKSLKYFKKNSKFSTWLYQIACNEFLQFKRFRSNQFHESLYFSENLERDTRVQNKKTSSSDPLLKNILIQSISELEERQREVFILRVVNGFTFIEISKLLGITQANTKNRMYRSKVALQEKFLEVSNDRLTGSRDC